jgi:hypothetical protein
MFNELISVGMAVAGAVVFYAIALKTVKVCRKKMFGFDVAPYAKHVTVPCMAALIIMTAWFVLFQFPFGERISTKMPTATVADDEDVVVETLNIAVESKMEEAKSDVKDAMEEASSLFNNK